MFELAGKTALVTGGGQGVGFGIAEVLCRQGARVLVNDIDEQRARAAAKKLGDAEACPFDVTDLDAVEAALSGEVIDILVNNAGNAGDAAMEMTAFRDMDPAQWKRFIDINLYGVLNCTKAVIDGMSDRGWGRIITISSDAGRVGLGINVSLYGAAKAASAHFMRHLAVEVGPSGLTANTLSVGLMNNVPEKFAGPLIKGIPVRRLGEPADIGHAVAYLASEEAGWVTGSTLQITGGVNPT